MKSIKNLRFTKSVVAIAIAAGGIATSSIAQSQFVPNIGGTQNDGHICRAGYSPAFNGTSLKCSKTSKVVVNLICTDPGFPNYVSRAQGSVGSNDGEDVCARNTVTITSTSNLSNLTKGQDFVSAKPNLAQITVKTTARDLEEGVAIGGSAASVETISADPVFARQSGGDITDSATVTLTHFSFPVPTVGAIPTNPTGAFVPRPLQ